ncbi:hypothetical protein NE237_011865 [Protea cynaroides]|uniref:Uncharacterized protein n=1 Tax=Protea cynaroides TaxID=273540 RepID=A0A9Q0JXH0_9MAGN|nr:hypothetical protein NE237_011865 [Protea cynaroides]
MIDAESCSRLDASKDNGVLNVDEEGDEDGVVWVPKNGDSKENDLNGQRQQHRQRKRVDSNPQALVDDKGDHPPTRHKEGQRVHNPERAEGDGTEQRVGAEHGVAAVAVADDDETAAEGLRELVLLGGRWEENEEHLAEEDGEAKGGGDGECGGEGVGWIPLPDGDVDEVEEGCQESRLEEAQGEDDVDLAEVGLLGQGDWREGGKGKRIAAAKEDREAEGLGECPQRDKGDEEGANSPEGTEVPQMVGLPGLEAEVDDEGKGEEGEE